MRTEHKYYLHLHEYAVLARKAAALLAFDPHSVNGDGYGIRSLYFDGPLDHALHDKNDGIFRREKYRIRIYNGSDDIILVERKSKLGEYVCKESESIRRKEYDQILAGQYDFLRDKSSPLLKEFHAALAYRAFRPMAIVDYWREAYIYESGNVRVTFDKKLSAGVNTLDLFDPHLVLEEAVPAPRTIMEIKFDTFLPDSVRQIIQPANHVRSSISKYVICREVNLMHYKQ